MFTNNSVFLAFFQEIISMDQGGKMEVLISFLFYQCPHKQGKIYLLLQDLLYFNAVSLFIYTPPQKTYSLASTPTNILGANCFTKIM